MNEVDFMKKYIGAVFFDIDGTLIDTTKNINEPPESARKAIKTLRDNGYLVGVATGRAECYLPEFAFDFDCIISCNGAIANVDGELVYNKTLPHNVAAELLNFIKSNGLGYVIETTDGGFYCDEKNENLNWHNWVFGPIDEYPHINGELKVNKVCTAYTPEVLEEIKKRFGNDIYIILHRFANFADIGAAGVSKAAGIRAVLNHFSIDIQNSYAFGDDNNDVEMLTSVGHGVAMTPHVAALDGLTEYVTDSVADDGIYKALKHYKLI